MPTSVTGWGVRVPGAASAPELWRALVTGGCAGAIESFAGMPFRERVAVARASGAAVEVAADRSVALGLAAVADAVAGHARFAAIDPERRGVVVATGFGPLGSVIDTAQAMMARGVAAIGPRTVPNLMTNGLAAAIALAHDCQGPAQTVATACASGTDALGLAHHMLLGEMVDVVVVCGADAPIRADVLAGFQRLGALSTETDDVTAACRPFDRDRAGFMMGEGASCLVLERGLLPDRFGSIHGYGATSDAHHLVAPRPDGAGALRAMTIAGRASGRSPDDIGQVNAHGTGTSLNDAAESAAIDALLGRGAAVWSVKGAIGHLMGAAGTTEAIATLLALREQCVPATAGLQEVDPKLAGIDVVRSEPRAVTHRFAISNSFAFGGHNASIVLGR